MNKKSCDIRQPKHIDNILPVSMRKEKEQE